MKVNKRTNPLSISRIDSSVQYQLLFENSMEPAAVLSPVLDMKGRLVDVLLVDANQAFCQAAGIPCSQMRGRLTRHFLPVLENRVEPLQAFLQDMGEVLKTGEPRTREIFLGHTNRCYRYRVFLLNNGLAAVTSVDITHQNPDGLPAQARPEQPESAKDRERPHDAQARIQHKIIEMREADRQQTANYLHEGLLQALIGVRYALEEGLSIEQKENRLARLASVQATLQREIQNLRDYCNELRPPTLAQFGLEKTIRAYVEVYQKKHARPLITLSLTPDRQILPDPHRLALFRVFQELFNRIVGNADVENLFVQFGIEEGTATLEFTFDGGEPEQSLDWTMLAQQGQISLASALGWIEGLGGRAEFQPLAGNTNKACIHIPVNSKI